MSIRKRQYTMKLRNVLAEQLKNGVAPDIATLNKKVKQELALRTLGKPSFKHTSIQKNMISNPELFNKSILAIHEDLSTAIEETMSLKDQIANTELIHQNNKLRLMHQIYLLNRRIFNFNIKTQTKHNTIFNTFADFKYVDFVGDATRGIPKTTAFMDLTKHQATLHGNDKEATLVSEKHEIPPALSVLLNVDHNIYPKTNILYFLAVDDGTGPVNWRHISPGNKMRLTQFNHNSVKLDSWHEQYDVLHDEYYGVKHYRIGSVPHNAVNLSVYMGDKMWAHESSLTTAQSPNVGLHNWADPTDVIFKLEEFGSSFLLTEKSFNRHTLHIYSEKNISVTSEFKIIGLGSLALYLNNMQIHGQNRYNLNFHVGWNKIELCSYAADNNTRLITDLDPLEVGETAYAMDEPLRQIEPHDLYHNTFAKDFEVFAIEDDHIVVNYSPATLSANGAIYDMQYYVNNSTENISVRLMAHLSSDGIEKPKINEYRLILE